jgi:ABC-type transport system involved in Fe-S cluster assembly fused permease/ATPase subunit
MFIIAEAINFARDIDVPSKPVFLTNIIIVLIIMFSGLYSMKSIWTVKIMLLFTVIRQKWQWYSRPEIADSDEPQFWMLDNLILFLDDVFSIVLACNYQP